MDLQAFLSLPTTEVAGLVRRAGPQVGVFPMNGTRRWFLLEHSRGAGDNWLQAYVDASVRRQLELYRLFFDHGVDTLLTPVFGADLADRGQAYLRVAADGLSRLAVHCDCLGFYEAYDVRVRFYGDYHKFFDPTPYAYLSDLFDGVADKTATHTRYRLFLGVCANDATETIGELAVQYYRQTGRAPDRRTLVELYYGEYVPNISFFIGFDKLSAFDMPLLATGTEDLYFTVSPSPYLTQRQLREILFDHLYSRCGEEPDYMEMKPEDWDAIRQFYSANEGRTIGVGACHSRWGLWYPLPQVELCGEFR